VLTPPNRARQVITTAGLAASESELIAVELPESAQPLVDICAALLQAEIYDEIGDF